MNLIGEYIGHVEAILSQGPKNDEYRFSDKHIYNILLYIRAVLIKNKANKMQTLNEFNYQTIPCMSLELANLNDCDCLPGVGCKYLRTSQPLPEILSNRNGLIIKQVTDMHGNIIPETTLQDNNYDKYSFTKKETVQYFIHNNYLFITNNKKLKRINITAIFYDPTAVNGLSSCDTQADEDCFDPKTMAFPMEKDLTSALFKMTYEEILGVAYQVPQDVENDAKNTVQG